MAEENQNNNVDQNTNTTTAEGVEVNTELSKVASNPKRNMIIMAVFGVVFLYIIYQIIASQNPETPAPPPALKAPTEVFKPNTNENAADSSIPAVPELPKIIKPTTEEKIVSAPTPPPLPQALPQTEAPAPAPNLVSTPAIPLLDAPTETAAEQQKRAEAKKKSSLFLINGKPPTLTKEEEEIQTNFTKRGNLSLVLGRGKIIDAVLESAINSDFPSEILALVSRDVYAEDGKVILIPKGSRVIGKFSATTTGGIARVNIEWFRIDIPSGFSINMASSTVDNLGRKGIQGRLDNKYKEQLSNVVLSSAFNIALAKGLDKLVPPVATNTTTASQNASATAISTAIGQIGTGDPAVQIANICTPLATSLASNPTTLASVQAACATANATVGAQGAAAVSTLITNLNSIAAGNTTTAAAASTESQEQKASTQAFKDITETVGDAIVTNNQFTPTITIDQGERIKIYVNKDYVFPLNAISKSRVMQ